MGEFVGIIIINEQNIFSFTADILFYIFHKGVVSEIHASTGNSKNVYGAFVKRYGEYKSLKEELRCLETDTV